MNITWQQMTLIWTVIVVSAGAAFTVCVYAGESKVSAYELRISGLEQRVQQLEKQLAICLKGQDRQVTAQNSTTTNGDVSLLSVLITYPKAGAIVNMRDKVEFVLQGELPPKHVAMLVIRDPTGQWWSWGSTKSGEFKRVQFGVERDSGESFEARILITDSPIPKNDPQNYLPDSIASDSVIVVRN